MKDRVITVLCALPLISIIPSASAQAADLVSSVPPLWTAEIPSDTEEGTEPGGVVFMYPKDEKSVYVVQQKYARCDRQDNNLSLWEVDANGRLSGLGLAIPGCSDDYNRNPYLDPSFWTTHDLDGNLYVPVFDLKNGIQTIYRVDPQDSHVEKIYTLKNRDDTASNPERYIQQFIFNKDFSLMYVLVINKHDANEGDVYKVNLQDGANTVTNLGRTDDLTPYTMNLNQDEQQLLVQGARIKSRDKPTAQLYWTDGRGSAFDTDHPDNKWPLPLPLISLQSVGEETPEGKFVYGPYCQWVNGDPMKMIKMKMKDYFVGDKISAEKIRGQDCLHLLSGDYISDYRVVLGKGVDKNVYFGNRNIINIFNRDSLNLLATIPAPRFSSTPPYNQGEFSRRALSPMNIVSDPNSGWAYTTVDSTNKGKGIFAFHSKYKGKGTKFITLGDRMINISSPLILNDKLLIALDNMLLSYPTFDGAEYWNPASPSQPEIITKTNKATLKQLIPGRPFNGAELLEQLGATSNDENKPVTSNLTPEILYTPGKKWITLSAGETRKLVELEVTPSRVPSEPPPGIKPPPGCQDCIPK